MRLSGADKLSPKRPISGHGGPERRLESQVIFDRTLAVLGGNGLNLSAPPGDLEAQIGDFASHYNHRRYHESLGNLTPADVYSGRGQTILMKREAIKLRSFGQRRLQHARHAA
jgi:hypothetical protein